MKRLRMAWTLCIPTLAAVAVGGCLLSIEIENPDGGSGSRSVSGRWPDGLESFRSESPGVFAWTCRTEPGSPDGDPDRLLLIATDRGYTWHIPAGMKTVEGTVTLTPDDPAAWHTMQLPAGSRDPEIWLPLPRTAIASPFYYDLLDLLQHLMPVGFAGIVHQWPMTPIPLIPVPAVSGAVDLQATLFEARDILNDRYGETLFGPPDESGNGIRLIHLAGHDLRPACYMSFVRRDSTGAPLRMQLVIGDTYDDPWDRPYALRAMLHELLHGALLWEHSLDRRHLLWRNGTIADRPSAGELAALRLWRALPTGLDLSRYDRCGELDP